MRTPTVVCTTILLLCAFKTTVGSILVILGFAGCYGIMMNVLAGRALLLPSIRDIPSIMLAEKPLSALLLGLIGTGSVLKTPLAVGVIIGASASRVMTLLIQHPLPRFEHKVHGRSSYADKSELDSMNRHKFCRRVAFRSMFCLVLLLLGPSYVASLESVQLTIAVFVCLSIMWMRSTFNIFDFDSTLIGGNMDSFDHIDAGSQKGIIIRQPASNEFDLRKYPYTVPIKSENGELKFITDGEKLKALACKCLDELQGENSTQIRYMGRREGEVPIHRFYCEHKNRKTDISEELIVFVAESNDLEVVGIQNMSRVPIIPKEVQKILSTLHLFGQRDCILTASCKYVEIQSLMNTDTPVLSSGKWFSCKAWFIEALLDGVVSSKNICSRCEQPVPVASHLFGVSFVVSTICIIIAAMLCGPALVTGDISYNRNHNQWSKSILLDYVILWFCTWCACLFIGPQTVCLFYDDSSQHTLAIFTQLGVSSVHVASSKGHLTVRDVALLQFHHLSLFISTIVVTNLISN